MIRFLLVNGRVSVAGFGLVVPERKLERWIKVIKAANLLECRMLMLRRNGKLVGCCQPLL